MWTSNLLPRAYDIIYERIITTFDIKVMTNHKVQEHEVTLYDMLQIQLILAKYAQPTLEFIECFDESDNLLTFNLRLGDTKKLAAKICKSIPFFADKEKEIKKVLTNIKIDAVVQYFVDAFDDDYNCPDCI